MTPLSARWLITAAWLWLFCCATYFLTAPGRLDIIDGAIRFDVTDSMLEIGRPAVRNPRFPGMRGADGFRYSFYPLGTSLIAVPFVELGGHLGNASLESKRFAFSLVCVPFAAATVSLLLLIWGRLGVDLRVAVRWALAVAFCTPMWVYAGSTFDTCVQAFFLTAGVWCAIEAMPTGDFRFAAASAISFAALINIQETYIVLGLAMLATVPRGHSSLWKHARNPAVQVIALGHLIGLLLVMGFNYYKFSNPLLTGRESVVHPLFGIPLVGLVGLLFSPAKSIFLYSPTYLLGILGLRALVSKDPAFKPMVSCLLAHLLLTSALRFWSGDWAWGPRYLIASLPVVCIGLPMLKSFPRWKRLAPAFVVLGFVVQFLGVSVDHQRFYFERSLWPFFWLDEGAMYRSSPLFARASEFAEVARGEGLDTVKAFVPGPEPMSMTSTPLALPPELTPNAHTWTRQYLAFVAPRPWPLWSRYLSQDELFGNRHALLLAGLVAALAGCIGLVSQISREQPA